jgi:predicted Zn-dependent peptidase
MGGGRFFDHTLDNGLRVVIESMPDVQSAAAGFLVRTGARDESPQLAGVSHFLEHMCFKGTPNRSWRQITVDFDNLGSTYNAYTSKERTFYFGWVRSEDLEKQIEIIADMMRSTLPVEEFEMERKVILEEIAMSADQIDRRVYDMIHERAFAGHHLAWPVLGTTESVSALSHEAILEYFRNRYQPSNMVLLVAGNVRVDDVMAMAGRHCGSWMAAEARPPRQAPAPPPTGVYARRSDQFQQQALALCYAAPSASDPERETADVLASILGGHNSRFFWNIIQAGIAPHVAAGRLDYCDTALMIAFGFCEPDRAGALLDAFRTEIQGVRDSGVRADEVQQVKNRVRTALMTEAEAPYYRLMQVVQDVDVLGRPRDVAERLAAIDAVTPDSIGAYLTRWPMTGEGFLACLGPRDWPKNGGGGQGKGRLIGKLGTWAGRY